ncbi:MAG: hypothetical protein AB7G93_07325 [Bdellovibrionales bacterium]
MPSTWRQWIRRFESIRWAGAISFTLGFLYGSIHAPMWNEIVDFGQVWAGLIPFTSNNLWYTDAVLASPSMLTYVSALLFKVGFGDWFVSAIGNGFVCGTAFLAFSLIGFIFSRSVVFAVLLPLLFERTNFNLPVMNHHYGVVFPTSTGPFGQLGSYLAMIAFALFALGSFRALFFLMGLLPGFHSSWGLAVLSSLTSTGRLCGELKSTWKRYWRWFAAGMAIVVLMVSVFSFWIRPRDRILAPEPVVACAAEGSSDRDHRPTRISSWFSHDFAKIPEMNPRRTMFYPHHQLLRDSEAPVKEWGRYLSSEMFLLLMVVLVFFVRPTWFGSEEKRVLLAMSVLSLIALGLKVYDEIDPHGILFQNTMPEAYKYYHRLIVGRWLNLNVLALPVITVGLLWRMAVERVHVVSLAALGYLLFQFLKVGTFPMILPFTVGQIFIVALVLSFVVSRLSFPKWQRLVGPLGTYAVLLILAGTLFSYGRQIATAQAFRGHNPFHELIDYLRQGSGGMIVAPELRHVGFNQPQGMTRRALFNVDPTWFKEPVEGRPISVFCFDDKILSYEKFVTDVRSCFEKRTPNIWYYIAKLYHMKDLVVPLDWEIHLPDKTVVGKWAVYHLPQECPVRGESRVTSK